MFNITNTTFSEEMAILADTEYGIGRLGNTDPPKKEGDAIVSVQSKGTGKAILIRGINMDEEGTEETGLKHHFTEEGHLGSAAVPNLLNVQKQYTIPDLNDEDNGSSHQSSGNQILGEKSRFHAEKPSVPFSSTDAIKAIAPRKEGACFSERSLPLKKRGHAKQQSPYKGRPSHTKHEGVMKRDLQKLKNVAESVDKEDHPTHLKDFKQLFESIVIDAVRRGIPIDINGRPHNILAVPVETAYPCAEGRFSDTGIAPRLDLYGGIIDRPPPSTSATSSVSVISGVSEDENTSFEDYRLRDVPKEIPYNEQAIYYNQTTLLGQTGYPCEEDPQEYTGNQRFFSPCPVSLKDSVMDVNYPFPRRREDEEVALDLSFKEKPSTHNNYENAKETHSPTMTDSCRTETPMDSSVAGRDYNINKKNSMSVVAEGEAQITTVATTNNENQNMLFNLSQLTPEYKMLLITMMKHMQNAPNVQNSTQTNCQDVSVEDDRRNEVVQSLPDLNRLELTNENGSYKETKNELVKRRLKAKLNS